MKTTFANGRRSIEAVHSIVASLPSLMNNAFVTSPYQSTPINGLSQILKKRGYSTWFFHGAKNGSMYFDISARSLQLDNYVGLNEYPHPKKDFDGSWGILDEPFLTSPTKSLKNKTAFFCHTFFTFIT